MLPDIPNFNLGDVHILTGKMLERIVQRIRLQTPIAGDNLRMEETNAGILLHADQAIQTSPTISINHDFKASLPATNSLDITAGRVIGTTWGTPTMSDPLPTDWLAEQFTVGPSTLTVTDGQSVWLRIQCSQTDVDMNGTLSATGASTITVTTGGGGAGGGGGGGGAGGGGVGGGAAAGVQPDIQATAGDAGANGDDTGLGGAGGIVLDYSTDPPTPVTVGNSYGASGGAGGYGGAGGAGGSVTFTRRTKGTAQIRKWSINGISLHTAKGTPSEASSWIQLASISGTSITQHVVGMISITPPAITFIIA